jgi:hypothetical protein
MDEEPFRLFGFRLRALCVLVLVTLCLYFGWNAYWVWERNAVKAWVRANGGMVDDGEESMQADLPFIRRMMGDEAVLLVGLPQVATATQRWRIVSAFPEALIARKTGPKEWAVH